MRFWCLKIVSHLDSSSYIFVEEEKQLHALNQIEGPSLYILVKWSDLQPFIQFITCFE